MEQKIIRRFPLPEMEVTEDELSGLNDNTVSQPAQFAKLSTAVAATNTAKKLNYTAVQINDKLAHANAYAVTSHTFNSYVVAVTTTVAQTGDSRFDATYLIVPYGDYINSPGGASPVIVNFKVFVKDGIIRTLRATCIAGKIDTSNFEVLAGDFKDNTVLFRLFIKSNGFRGLLMIRELSLDASNVKVGYSIKDMEYTNIVPQWNLFPAGYDNVASEVAGLTKPWVMNINRLPTGNADLFSSFFKENIGFENTMDFFSILKSGQPIPIILNFCSSSGALTSITTNSEVKYRQDMEEIDFDLSFVFKSQSYRIKFTIWDDGQPGPGSGEVAIKAL